MEVDMFDFHSFKLFLYHLIPHCCNDYGKAETDSDVKKVLDVGCGYCCRAHCVFYDELYRLQLHS